MAIPVVAGERVGYIADLVAPNRLPFFFMPDFTVAELERTLGEILNLDMDRVVYTHSANADPLAGGSRQDVADTLGYLQDLRAALAAEIDSGTPARMASDAVRLPKYEDWAMYDQWLALNAWKIWLEGHLGPF